MGISFRRCGRDIPVYPGSRFLEMQESNPGKTGGGSQRDGEGSRLIGRGLLDKWEGPGRDSRQPASQPASQPAGQHQVVVII